MKNCYLALLLLFFTTQLYAQNKLLTPEELQRFPSYKTIVQEFFTLYSYTYTKKGIELEFARKPDGWWVRQYDYVNNALVSNDHFWKPNKFLKLKSHTPKEEDITGNYTFENKYTIRDSINFQRHPFFGYSYWAEDVIKHLEPQIDHLNDTLTYGLGRAYSAMAVNLTSNQFGFKQKPEIFFEPGGNCITPSQKEQLIRLNTKAIRYFQRADSLNPKLCVVVGTINTKYCNEYVDLFYKLWPLESIDSAAAILPNGLYTANMLTSAKNYLASCKPNAILFSDGDNDTYPLYYVQAIEGFRRDVSVVNISMQSTPMHIDATTRGFCELPLVYSIPLVEYENNYSYLVMDKDGENLPFENLTTSIFDGNKVNASTVTLSNLGNTYRTSAKKGYILRGTLAVWDLINSNPTRPIHFTQANHATTVGLEDFVQFNGFTTTLTNDSNPDLTAIVAYLKDMRLDGYDDSTNYVFCTETKQWQNSLALNTMRTEVVKLLYYNKYQTEWQPELKEIYQLFKAINKRCFVPLPQHLNPEILEGIDQHYSK